MNHSNVSLESNVSFVFLSADTGYDFVNPWAAQTKQEQDTQKTVCITRPLS